MRVNDTKAYTIPQFCESHNLPVSTYYQLQREGVGPRTIKAGRRILISIEAAEEWRNNHTPNQSSE